MPTTTITNQPNRHEYTAGVGQSVFTFDFQIFNGVSDLEVTVDGVAAAFNLSLIGDEGGEITLTTACAGLETVIIQRVIEPERASQFPNAGPLARATLNHELNRVVGLIQDVSQNVERAALMDRAEVIDLLEEVLSGAGSVTISRADDVITITGTMLEETVRDTVAAFLVAGVGIQLSHNDAGDQLTIVNNSGSGGTGLTVEETQDVVGAMCVAGSGISLAYNDVSNTLTITNTGSSYTDEMARDACMAIMYGTNGINVSVDDALEQIIIQEASRLYQLPVMAGSMEPHPSPTYAPTPSSAAVGANQTPLRSLDFDASNPQYCYWMIPMPKGWNEGTITYQVLWTAASGSGDVIWNLDAQAVTNGDSLDPAAYGAPVQVTDTMLGAGQLHTTAVSGDLTIGGAPAPEDVVVFRLNRNANLSGDTLAASARLVGIRLWYRRSWADDS